MLLVLAALTMSSTVGAQPRCAPADELLRALQRDALFSRPYVDADEWRDEPVRHRYVHGGFEGTDTRFSYYLPPEEQYGGRFFQYITPVPMSETLSQGATGEEDRIGFSVDSGAYFIETNGGGPLPGPGGDHSITAYRANAAAAQYSRVVAMAMYGCRRPFGYAFGGSGGGYRTIGGMENTRGVWDGAVPYVIGSPMALPNVFTVRNYALRVLADKLPAIADAVDAGSRVDPFDLVAGEQAAALAEVTRMGFPLPAWYAHDQLGLHGFRVILPGVVAADPTYFREDFWNKPGYEGSDPPASLRAAIVEHSTTIEALLSARELGAAGIEGGGLAARGLADDAWKSLLAGGERELPAALQLGEPPTGNTMGADIVVGSGAAAGKQLAVYAFADDIVVLGPGDPAVLSALRPGDKVQINNRNFLAAQTYHRHQVPGEGYSVWDQFRDANGKPLYPQRPRLLGPLFTLQAVGSLPGGGFDGKMIVVENLLDTEAYPWQGDWYRDRAAEHFGDRLDEHFRLWYTERANHGDTGEQDVPTQTVSYLGVLQQALRDVSAWVERGEAPAPTTAYRIDDGQVAVAESAARRGGIQPAVHLLANGSKRAEVGAGEAVELSARIEAPPGSGKIVSVAWDFDGSGEFPQRREFAGEEARTALTARTGHSYATPGTHFVTVRVALQRDGDTATPYARVQNLDRVRVVVE